MQKKLNVLFLSSWYPCPDNEHNGNFVVRHAVAVAKYANVYLIYLCSEKNIKTVKKVESINNGVREIRIFYPRVKNSMPVLGYVSRFFRIRRLYYNAFLELKNELGNIDVIHANVTYPIGVVARYIHKKSHIPFVITEHWTGYMPENRKSLSYYGLVQSRLVGKDAAFIMPVSYDLKNSMERLRIRGNYRVVYNVVDTGLFTLKEPKHNPLRFIHVSTLDDVHKNISGILRAVKALSNERDDFTMVIVGDGNTKPHRDYAKKLAIPNKLIKIEGAKPIEEIAAMMRQSDVFVLFSNYESFSCVISEALCTGMPVISSNTGAIGERLDKSNGILIEPKDEEALKDSMAYFIDNYSKYDAAKIRADAVKKYNYDVVGQQFVEIYHEAVKG